MVLAILILAVNLEIQKLSFMSREWYCGSSVKKTPKASAIFKFLILFG